MALGDIKKTLHYEIVYAPKGTGTLVAGRAVATDANGLWIPATASTLGTHGIYSGITHVQDGVTYYGVLVEGYISCEGGGAVKPNQPVKSDASGKLVVASTTVTTPTQAEVQELWKVLGRYIRLASDNQYNPSDLADTSEGVVKIGRGVA
jgi:hypothetical protein